MVPNYTSKTILSPGNSLCSGPFESPGRGGFESFPVSSPGYSAWPQLPMADPVCPLNHGEKLRPPVVECLFRSIFLVLKKSHPPFGRLDCIDPYLRSVHLKNFYGVGVHFFMEKRVPPIPRLVPVGNDKTPARHPRKTLQSSNFEGSHNFPPNSKSLNWNNRPEFWGRNEISGVWKTHQKS